MCCLLVGHSGAGHRHVLAVLASRHSVYLLCAGALQLVSNNRAGQVVVRAGRLSGGCSIAAVG